MKRIRPAAVIFDYGNVLSAPQGLAEVETMRSILNVAADPFHQAYWRFRLAYDEAELDDVSYWRQVSRDLSRRLGEDQIAALAEVDGRGWSYPDPVLPHWARQVRATGIKTALLSNMPASVRDHILRCDWLPRFDQRIFSCDLRVAKPSQEIFRHCLQRLDVDPPQALFLDDRPENVRAAEALGLHGIVCTTANQVAREIADRFDVPLPGVAEP